MRQTLTGLPEAALIIVVTACVVLGIAAIVNFMCLSLYYW